MCDQTQKPAEASKELGLSLQQVVVARHGASGEPIQWWVPGIVALALQLPNNVPEIGQVSAVKVGDYWYVRPHAATEALLNQHFDVPNKSSSVTEDVARQLLAHLGGPPRNDFFGYTKQSDVPSPEKADSKDFFGYARTLPKVQFGDDASINAELDKHMDTVGEALP